MSTKRNPRVGQSNMKEAGKLSRSDSVKTVSLDVRSETRAMNGKGGDGKAREMNGHVEDNTTDKNNGQDSMADRNDDVKNKDGKDKGSETNGTIVNGNKSDQNKGKGGDIRKSTSQQKPPAGKFTRRQSSKTFSEKKQPKNYKIINKDRGSRDSLIQKDEGKDAENDDKSPTEAMDAGEEIGEKGYQYNEEEERFDQNTEEWGDGDDVSLQKLIAKYNIPYFLF